MFKNTLSFDNKILNLKLLENNKNKKSEEVKSYIEMDKTNKNIKSKIYSDVLDELKEEEEKGNKPNVSNVERIKIYYTKKNTSKIKEKPLKKFYHNEINKKENNEIKEEKNEIKVLRKNRSKIKSDILQLNCIKTNDILGNMWNTDRDLDDKNDDIHCNTMAATPKKKFKNNFKNLISLNKDKKLVSHKNSYNFLHNSNSSKKTYNRRNLIKSNDFSNFSGFYKEKNSEFFLTTQENDNDLIGKYLLDTDTNYTTKEINDPIYLKNFEINKIYERKLKTPREKSIHKVILKDNINNNDFGKKYSNLKNIENYYSQKGYLQNSSKKNLQSQKTLYTPRSIRSINNKSLNNNHKSYKSLSKSKDNNNYMNKTFYFTKNTMSNNNFNFNINKKICNSSVKNNYKNKILIDSKDTNKYLAPIIESNIVIENENCHFLENTICAKNKIVKKRNNLKEEYPTLRKVHNYIENNDKKNSEKNKNDKEKDKEKNIFVLKEANKNTNKRTFTNAVNKLYKKPQKKLGINIKNSINNSNKNQKSFNNIPDMLHYNRNISRQKVNLTRGDSIENSISNLSTISNSHVFNGKIGDYSITKELGKGSYAVVKLAMHKITKQKYAIKIYTKESLLDPQKRNTVKNEINILKQLNHINIMKLYEVIDHTKYLYLVQEYIKGISLLEVLKSETNHYIGQNRALKLYLQVLNAISYCQSKNINHRDIKLENILVIQDDIIKLIDFGFAIKSNKETYQKLLCGTPSYMAPEIVNKEKYIAQYSDVWSLGVLLYTMLFGRFPFRAKDDEKLFRLINEGIIVFPEDIPVHGYIKNLIKKILNINPRLRPNIDEIINEINFAINLI